MAMVQGRRFASTVTMAPPAAGSPSGSVDGRDGPPVRLVVLGDSMAAGHGVSFHGDGLAAQLAARLADRWGRPVAWRTIGQFGATTRRIRHRLLPTITEPCDVAVLMAGGNDVLSRRPLSQSQDDYAAILDGLTAWADRVVAFGVPPFRCFPSLPWALSRYLSARGARFDAMARRLCHERGVDWISASVTLDDDFFARDGFHPAPVGYAFIADTVADALGSMALR
jgi:lysophospholipase L1-like esterase